MRRDAFEGEEFKTQLIEPKRLLLTPRLQLEPLVVAHAPLVYTPLLDARLYAFILQEPPASIEALVARYQKLAARRSPDGSEVWLNWAVRLRASDDTPSATARSVPADYPTVLPSAAPSACRSPASADHGRAIMAGPSTPRALRRQQRFQPAHASARSSCLLVIPARDNISPFANTP